MIGLGLVLTLTGCIDTSNEPGLPEGDSYERTYSVPATTPILLNQSPAPTPVVCSPGTCIQNHAVFRPQPPFDGATPLLSHDINELISWFGPDLKIPVWLPEGYIFSEGVLWEPESDGRHEIFYEKGFESLNIVFSYHTDMIYRGFLPGDPKKVCINGTEGFSYGENTTRQLRWCDGSVIRWITGNAPEEELLRIAESMDYPYAVNITSGIYNNSLLLPQTPAVPVSFPFQGTHPVTPDIKIREP